MASAAQLEQLITVASHSQFRRYFDAVAATLYMYDMILTTGMEVELIWPSRWNYMKALYFVQRYLPFIDTVVLVLYQKFGTHLSQSTCRGVFNASGWLFTAGMALSELILTLRAWAVWGNSRRLGYTLPVFFMLCWVPNFSVLAIFLRSMSVETLDAPGLNCFVSGGSPILFVCWVMLMSYEAGILTLMAIPGFSAYRTGGDSALFRVVYRDGIIYYIYLFALSILNVALILKLPADYVNLLSSLERVIHPILASRVVLHIRAQVVESMNQQQVTKNDRSVCIV